MQFNKFKDIHSAHIKINQFRSYSFNCRRYESETENKKKKRVHVTARIISRGRRKEAKRKDPIRTVLSETWADRTGSRVSTVRNEERVSSLLKRWDPRFIRDRREEREADSC